jgi:hypothetical protein
MNAAKGIFWGAVFSSIFWLAVIYAIAKVYGV